MIRVFRERQGEYMREEGETDLLTNEELVKY